MHHVEHAGAIEDTSSAQRWKAGELLCEATEDYLRSRRIFKTTSNANTHDNDPMQVDALSRKGREVKGHTEKGCGEQAAEKPSHFEGECRNSGKNGHKAADCWHKQEKSKESKVSESENHKHDDGTRTPASSPQRSSSSQVNTIGEVGYANERLWMFS